MTPEILAKVAKGLDWADLEVWDDLNSIYSYRHRLAGSDEVLYASDGDLLLAILNRAAELGYRCICGYWPEDSVYNKHAWECYIERTSTDDKLALTYADTSLEAAALAFAQLPECQ